MYVVTVNIDLKPGAVTEFMPLMITQRDTSLAMEPDCHVFDVCRDADTPQRVFLYEVYTDAAAFDAHLATAHFKAFDAAVQPMIAEKSIKANTRL